ncbi:hypothetical protein Tcan_18052, partial [Toxocara canis]
DEEIRRRSVADSNLPKSRDVTPHGKNALGRKTALALLDELNFGGVPVDVFCMGVIQKDRHLLTKVVFSNTHDAEQVLRQSVLLKSSRMLSHVYIRQSLSKAELEDCRQLATGMRQRRDANREADLIAYRNKIIHQSQRPTGVCGEVKPLDAHSLVNVKNSLASVISGRIRTSERQPAPIIPFSLDQIALSSWSPSSG